jgi:hypothetical protein
LAFFVSLTIEPNQTAIIFLVVNFRKGMEIRPMVFALGRLLVGIILVIAGVDLMISKSVMYNIATGGMIFVVGAAIFMWGLRRLDRAS